MKKILFLLPVLILLFSFPVSANTDVSQHYLRYVGNYMVSGSISGTTKFNLNFILKPECDIAIVQNFQEEYGTFSYRFLSKKNDEIIFSSSIPNDLFSFASGTYDRPNLHYDFPSGFNGTSFSLSYITDIQTSLPIFATEEQARLYLLEGVSDGQINVSFDDDSKYVYDKSLGYIQNVIFKETRLPLQDPVGSLSWTVNSDYGNDCRVQVKADYYYTVWLNKTTSEFSDVILYSDGLLFSSGGVSFPVFKHVRKWMDYRGFDYSNPVKYQNYGVSNYYLRLVKRDGNVVKHGGWVKVDVKRGNSIQLPFTDVETGFFDDTTGEWNYDGASDGSYKFQTGGDGTIVNPIKLDSLDDINLNVFTWFWTTLKAMVGSMGDFPNLIMTVFSFIPSVVISAIAVLLIGVVILRFLGR